MRISQRTALLLSTMALVMSTVTLVIAVSHISRPHVAPGEPSGQSPLAGTTWLLESLGPSGNPRPPLTTTEVTLAFSDDGRVSGNAGCNAYFGQYVWGADGTLSVSGLGSTKMLCHEEGVMQQEQDFLAALSQAGDTR
jgi:heat shock protein HslJ